MKGFGILPPYEYAIKIWKHKKLLLITKHTTKGSKDVEVQAIKSRIKKREVSHAEVIQLIEPYDRETIYE